MLLDFINKLENGFDYYLSENGRELSGGQRQGLTSRAIVENQKSYCLMSQRVLWINLQKN